MAAIAVAGVGLMVVCSSSLAAVMLMGGEEETPDTTTSPHRPQTEYVYDSSSRKKLQRQEHITTC
jgi:hypothetical protein